jgi:predicted  nucleic acid-binding Zn-ribbon protein
MKIAINYLKVHIEELKYQRRNTLKTHKELRQLYTDSINSMTKAIEHLKQAGKKCEWMLDDGIYDTNCKDAFYFSEGNLISNDFKYCPYCGREIEEVNVD